MVCSSPMRSLDIMLISAFSSVTIIFPLLSTPPAPTKRKKSYDKLSTYECGFTSFDDARGSFDVDLYIIAISSPISDVELIVLVPSMITEFSIETFIVTYVLLGLSFPGPVPEREVLRQTL